MFLPLRLLLGGDFLLFRLFGLLGRKSGLLLLFQARTFRSSSLLLRDLLRPLGGDSLLLGRISARLFLFFEKNVPGRSAPSGPGDTRWCL